MFGPWRLGLAKDQAGSLSTVTALLMPALMAAAGLGADTLHWTWQQQIMQRQAESAALAGAEALSQIRANSFGLGSVMTAPTITPGAANGQDFVDITVTVNPQFDLFFIEVEPITLSETRRVYRPA